jgi:hypothetical protein
MQRKVGLGVIAPTTWSVSNFTKSPPGDGKTVCLVLDWGNQSVRTQRLTAGSVGRYAELNLMMRAGQAITGVTIGASQTP